MAGTSNSITTHNVLSGVLNADNVISGLVNTAFNPAYALVTQAGAQIVLFINNNDYKMYAQLKDKSGNLIYTSNIIDLPLETMVVDGRYDSNTKKLILVLDNGNEIKVPLEALINGLVNEDDLEANYYDKNEIDTLLEGYWTKIEITQEDIDNWNAKQEYLNQGDGIEISAETILKGNTSQESTTGKNLLNVPNPYSINGVVTAISLINTIPAGTYTISCGNVTKGGGQNPRLRINDYFIELSSNLSFTITIPSEITSAYFYSNGANYVESQGVTSTVENLMISTSGGDYEPYTGGNPAPNPDYPQPIQVVTGDNEVKVEGKNLLQKQGYATPNTDSDYWEGNPTFLTSGDDGWGTFAFDNSSGSSVAYKNMMIKNGNVTYKPSTNYTIFIELKDVSKGSATGDMLFLSQGANTRDPFSSGEKKITYNEATNKVYRFSATTKADLTNTYAFRTFVAIPAGKNVSFKIRAMIVEGTYTSDTYISYQSQTYPINLGSMELCKIGDYQDYLYKENGIWYKYGAIGKVVLTGNNQTEAWNKDANIDTEYDYFYTSNFRNIAIIKPSNFITDKFSKLNYIQGAEKNGFYATSVFIINIAKSLTGITSDDTLAQRVAKFRTWLSNNNVLVYYVLATPTVTPITDTTLISQLNALTTGLSNKWIKNISQTNAEIPFELEYDNKNLTISASSNLVRDTDYATTTKAGLIRANNYYGTAMYNEYLIGVNKTYADYGTSPNNMYISKGTLENVITGKELTNKTYVDAADAVFQSELFDDGVISVEDSTEANINNTMNKSQLKIDLKGNTSQESTTGKNLVPNTLASGSSSGITYTVNSDGSIKLSGTATARVEPYLYKDNNNPITFKAGTYRNTSSKIMILYADGYILAPPNQTFSLDEDKNVINIYFRIENGEIVNETYYPQIILNSIADTSYEPYTGGNPAPSPDYPYPVNVVTGDNEVKVEGKNIFDGILENGTYTSTGVKEATALLYRNKNIISVKPETTYTFSINGANQKYVVYFYDNTQTFISWSSAFSTGVISTPSNAYYMNFRCFADDYNANFLNLKVQLEEGSTATPYEPYIGKSYPIYLGVENLWNTDKLKDGFIPASGTYPINNTNFPNAKYLLVYLYKGQSLTIANQTDTGKRGRIRYIDKDTNLVIDNVRATTNAYYTSNFEGTDGFKNGTITALKDFILAFMTIDVADTRVNADVTYGTTPQYISDTPIELCKIGDYQDYIAKSTGKNLFDKDDYNSYEGYISGTETTTIVNASNNNIVYIECLPNTQYTVSKIISKRFRIGYSIDIPNANVNVYGVLNNDTQTSLTITTGNNARYLVVYLRNGNLDNEVPLATILNSLQIEKGSTATNWEPYGKVWYKYSVIGKAIVDGSEDWRKSGDARNISYYYASSNDVNYKFNGIKTNIMETTGGSSVYPAYSTYFKFIANETLFSDIQGAIFDKISNIIELRFGFGLSTSISTLELFNQWLSNNNVTVYFPLATPTATPITDTTLIEQLDNLEKAYSYDTQTNISQTNQDKPFILDINAIADNVNGLKLENENQEYKTNKVIELSSNSTDDEYPSAKCVYDIVGNIEAVLAAMDSGSGV